MCCVELIAECADKTRFHCVRARARHVTEFVFIFITGQRSNAARTESHSVHVVWYKLRVGEEAHAQMTVSLSSCQRQRDCSTTANPLTTLSK